MTGDAAGAPQQEREFLEAVEKILGEEVAEFFGHEGPGERARVAGRLVAAVLPTLTRLRQGVALLREVATDLDRLDKGIVSQTSPEFFQQNDLRDLASMLDGLSRSTSLPSGGRSEERQKLLAEYDKVRGKYWGNDTDELYATMAAADALASHIREQP